ncbi:MAG: class I SAM-dependent methyltransferase [Patescibacteria group bacterium]
MTTLVTKADSDYELLDTGEGEKMERFGEVVCVRPDPEALWKRRIEAIEWRHADARYERKGEKGSWKERRALPKSWPIQFGSMTLSVRLTSFKHVGVFPEQLANWEWIRGRVKKYKAPKILNLFAYTGAASIAAAQAGADVTHVDASKVAVEWARENARLSKLADAPIRYIVDDVSAFVAREVRRGSHYDGIILDPPAFGHGPKRELWKIEKSFLPLMQDIEKLLSPGADFVLISGYSSGYSPLMLKHNLLGLKTARGGEIEIGELTIEESPSKPPPMLVSQVD